jgi:hypothetical protein
LSRLTAKVVPKLLEVLNTWHALLALNDYRSLLPIKEQHIGLLAIRKDFFLADLGIRVRYQSVLKIMRMRRHVVG